MERCVQAQGGGDGGVKWLEIRRSGDNNISPTPRWPPQRCTGDTITFLTICAFFFSPSSRFLDLTFFFFGSSHLFVKRMKGEKKGSGCGESPPLPAAR